MRIVTAILLTLAAILTPVVPAAQAAGITKRLAVVVIQNGDTAGEQQDLADTGRFRSLFFGGSSSLATWMTAVSQSRVTFGPAGDGVYTTQPDDALRDAPKSGCHTNLATKVAEAHMKSLGVTYDSLAIVFDIASCGWGGLGQVPGRITWYPPDPSLAAVVHEFGHNLGYPHQNKRDCKAGNMSACGDAHCCNNNTPMSGGGDRRGYSATELLHVGWVDSAAKTVATKPGTFNLKPLYATGSGTKVVEYKATKSLSYVIETRAPASGVDSAISNPGVRVYTVTNGDYRHAALIDPGSGYSPAGSIITDNANKLRIVVQRSSASGATVAVQSLLAPTASPSPSASPVPSPSAMASPTPEASASADPLPDTESDLVSAAEPPPSKSDGASGWQLAVIAFGLLASLALIAVIFRLARRPRRP